VRRIEEFIIEFEKKPSKFTLTAFDILDSAKGAVVIVFIVFAFVLRPVSVEGMSMYPTLNDKDWVAVAGAYQDFDYGDIVVINQPWEQNVPIIKRVIAKGGDTVYIDFATGRVFVNDKKLEEDYIAELTSVKYDVEFPVTVEEGKVFVMGDNRNDSLDSRSTKIGTIDERYILGKAVFRFLPLFSFEIYEGAEK